MRLFHYSHRVYPSVLEIIVASGRDVRNDGRQVRKISEAACAKIACLKDVDIRISVDEGWVSLGGRWDKGSSAE